MATGFGILRLSPSVFWSMTPKEFEAALRGLLGDGAIARPPARGELSALMARYPDGTENRE
jgi:uncharacterized phage protein (TIGR02216 family)